MFRLTPRKIVGLAVIAGISFFVGLLFTPADPVAMAIGCLLMFGFGAGSYFAGVAAGKADA